MYFSWFDENRSFKRGKGISGQIAPFLLVILVILLVAAIATVNIGRVSLDKTCSANGADAGSLAAASEWAGSFNALARINESITEYYDLNYYTMGQLYAETERYIENAIIYGTTSFMTAGGAYTTMYLWDNNCPASPWYGGLVGSILLMVASWLALEASMETQALGIVAQYMKSITESFHEQQWKNYADMRNFMAESYFNSRKQGLIYAFQNSCIPNKLSIEQNDEFRVWLYDLGRTKMPEEEPIPEEWAIGVEIDRTYTWRDSLNQAHSVSVSLDLPYIGSYSLRHTKGSYSGLIDDIDEIYDRSVIIAAALNAVASTFATTAVTAAIAFVQSVISVIWWSCCSKWTPQCCWNGVQWCWSSRTSQNTVLTGLGAIIAILEGIVLIAGAVSLLFLQDNLEDFFDGWAPGGEKISTSVEDARDLMIYKIDAVNLPRWDTTCCVTQRHPGTSAGIVGTTYPDDGVRSCSTSQFSGGSVGAFLTTYDPKIIRTDYEERLIDNLNREGE